MEDLNNRTLNLMRYPNLSDETKVSANDTCWFSDSICQNCIPNDAQSWTKDDKRWQHSTICKSKNGRNIKAVN